MEISPKNCKYYIQSIYNCFTNLYFVFRFKTIPTSLVDTNAKWNVMLGICGTGLPVNVTLIKCSIIQDWLQRLICKELSLKYSVIYLGTRNRTFWDDLVNFYWSVNAKQLCRTKAFQRPGVVAQWLGSWALNLRSQVQFPVPPYVRQKFHPGHKCHSSHRQVLNCRSHLTQTKVTLNSLIHPYVLAISAIRFFTVVPACLLGL